MRRRKRCDRNHVLYRITCVDTGETYLGLTAALGRAYRLSVKIRWQKHQSRARRDGKDWKLCQALRERPEAVWLVEVLEVVRGRQRAHQRERELIAVLQPALNTA